MASLITLVPLGEVEPDLLSWLQEALAKNVGHTVDIGPGLALPAEGYDARREQYDGGAILAALRSYDAPGAERVVGLVAADCFAPRLNFIFGQAVPGGRECFVALPRLNPTYYGQPENPDLYHQRVLKEVTHELGHTWNLKHCSNPHCVMYFSNTLRDTDLKNARICRFCQTEL